VGEKIAAENVVVKFNGHGVGGRPKLARRNIKRQRIEGK